MEIAKEVIEAWKIHFDHYDPADEGRRESLLAIGNGCVVSRATAPESEDDKIHYPGTYRVGCYNELISHIQGQDVKNESMVNLPNWLPLSFRIEKGNWFSLEDVTILAYAQTLHMQQGLLTRTVHFRDKQGRETLVEEHRFISMDQPHLMGLCTELTPLNWAGEVEVSTGLDGRISNNKVARYNPYNRSHLVMLRTGEWAEDGLELVARTTQSRFKMVFTTRTKLEVHGKTISPARQVETKADSIFSYQRVPLEEGEKLRIEKIAALYTSINIPETECEPAARAALEQAPAFERLLDAHKRAWEKLWSQCQLDMDNKEQLRLFRLHIYHILQNFSPHTVDMDVGVPPSGWQGEEYHGQVFWDGLFIFPFLTFHFPDSAWALLHYRYRRLNAARQLARENGYKGAMFPWRSASDGEEETPPYQLYPLSGRWVKDNTYLQRHIGAVVAYNVWYYVQVTGDIKFMTDCGAELFLEIARFWGSIATYNPELDRYEICGVVGPDEYHTKYPGAEKPGLRNNSYTNILAVWTLTQASKVLDLLTPQKRQELCEKLHLYQEELDLWDKISRKMRIIFNPDGTICQYEGFDQLKSLDIQDFRQQHGQERLDWVLEAQGDSVENYKISKQADTPLLMYLFTNAELIKLFDRLGYTIEEEVLTKTLRHHLAHTAHESTLSKIVFAGAFAALDPAASWKFFEQAQQVDLSPQDIGTAEGIHMGAMGGTLAVLQHHYLRWKVCADTLKTKAALPKAIQWISYSLCFRGNDFLHKADPSSESLQAIKENKEEGLALS